MQNENCSDIASHYLIKHITLRSMRLEKCLFREMSLLYAGERSQATTIPERHNDKLIIEHVFEKQHIILNHINSYIKNAIYCTKHYVSKLLTSDYHNLHHSL